MLEDKKTPQEAVTSADSQSDDISAQHEHEVDTRSSKVPRSMKILAVFLVTCIGFGSHWSTGVTGAMKSTLKKANTVL